MDGLIGGVCEKIQIGRFQFAVDKPHAGSRRREGYVWLHQLIERAAELRIRREKVAPRIRLTKKLCGNLLDPRRIGFGLLEPWSKRRHFPRGDDHPPRPCVRFDLAIGRERQALNTGKNQYRIRNPDPLDCLGVDEIKIEPGVENLRKDRKSTRLNSSHGYISYAVFCLKKKIQLVSVRLVAALVCVVFTMVGSSGR